MQHALGCMSPTTLVYAIYVRNNQQRMSLSGDSKYRDAAARVLIIEWLGLVLQLVTPTRPRVMTTHVRYAQ